MILIEMGPKSRESFKNETGANPTKLYGFPFWWKRRKIKEFLTIRTFFDEIMRKLPFSYEMFP